jgi:hypothetical protein
MTKKQTPYQRNKDTNTVSLSFFQQIAALKISSYFRQGSQVLELLGEHAGNIKGLLNLSRIEQIEMAEDLIKRMEKMHQTSGEILNLTKAELQTYKLKLEQEEDENQLNKSKKKVQEINIPDEEEFNEDEDTILRK